MPKTNSQLNYKIAITGAFSALSIILGFTPLGYISLGGLLNLTIMHIPVILASIIGGFVPGLVCGFIFGLSSLVKNAMMGGAPFFLNPLISIVPRMIIAVVSWLIFNGLTKIKFLPKFVSGGITAAFGTLTNTVFVMLGLYVFFPSYFAETIKKGAELLGFNAESITFIKGYIALLCYTLITNGLAEIIAAVLITTAVLSSIYIVKGKKSKLSKIEDK